MIDNLSYQAYKIIAKEIDNLMDINALEMKTKFPIDGIMGMRSDITRSNPEYQKIYQEGQMLLKRLQDFNKNVPKEFKTKRSQEWRSKTW